MNKIIYAFIFLSCISTTLPLHAQSFLNGSFENWGIPGACEINVSPDSWTNYSTGCIAFDEANILLCTSTIPGSASNGNIYARACAGPDWQGGEGIYQYVNNLTPGQAYTFGFDYAGSNLYGGTDSVTWRVFIDDVLVAQTPYFSSLQATWNSFMVGFNATQSTHKIGFKAYFVNPCVTCAGSAGIDNIHFNEGPTNLTTPEDETLVSLFPVPADNKLTIINTFPNEAKVELYDMNGRMVLSTLFKHKTELNTSTLPAGLYECLIRSNGALIYKKVISKN